MNFKSFLFLGLILAAPVQSTVACSAASDRSNEAVNPVPVVREYGALIKRQPTPGISQSQTGWPIPPHNSLWISPQMTGLPMSPAVSAPMYTVAGARMPAPALPAARRVAAVRTPGPVVGTRAAAASASAAGAPTAAASPGAALTPIPVVTAAPVAAAAAAPTAATAAGLDNSSATAYVSSLMRRKPNVSDAFVSEITRQFTDIPINVRAALQRSGYHLTLSRTVPSAVPSILGKQVRGYQRSTTWNNIFGMFNRGSKQVIMAEYAESEGAAPRLVTLNDSRRRLGILKHECGHAVDEMLQNYSHGAAFASAYNKGVARLSSQYDRQMLEYYLQPGYAGKEEAFAEVFAIACGNGCHPDTDALLRRNFPELIGLIARRIQSV